MVQPVRLVSAALGHAVWWLGYQMQSGETRSASDAESRDEHGQRSLATLSGVEPLEREASRLQH